jgi:hypothetical protein
MTELELRQKNMRLTMAKYGTKPFKWGSCDCAKIAAFHARKFGWKPPKTGEYRSAAGAVKYLKSLGAETLPDLITNIGLPEIAPARAMTGDIVSVPAEHPIGAIGIYADNGNIMIFHEDHQTLVFADMSGVERAWSIMPRPADG